MHSIGQTISDLKLTIIVTTIVLSHQHHCHRNYYVLQGYVITTRCLRKQANFGKL